MMISDPLFDRERDSLFKLQKLVRDRSAGETTLSETYQKSVDDAEKEVQKSRKTITAARVKATGEFGVEHEANMTAITTKYDSAQANADKKKQDLRKRTVDQYSGALEKARTDYSDKLWALDSIHEAMDKEADDKLADMKRKAAASSQKIDALWKKAEPILAKFRLSRERVEFPEDRLPSPTETDPVGKVQKCLEDSEDSIKQLGAAPLPKLAGVKGLAIFLLVFAGIGAGVGFGAMQMPVAAIVAAGGAVVGLIAWVVVGVLAKGQVRDRATALGVFQAEAARAVRLLLEWADATHAKERADAALKHETDKKKAEEYHAPRITKLEKQLEGTLTQIDSEHNRVSELVRINREADTKKELARFHELTKGKTAGLDAELAAAEKRYKSKLADATATRDATFDKLANHWKTGLDDVSATARDLIAFGQERYPAWPEVLRADRQLPTDAPPGVRYGELEIDQFALPDGMPADSRLNPENPIKTKVPAYLPFPHKAAVLLKARNEGRTTAVTVLQAMMLRFLTGIPPGKVRFTIIDPVGLGENFAAFMHLSDFDEKLVTSRIWTEPQQIESRLEDLTEHMENVIQKYLRNQYKSIEEYNRAAGEVAEPYRVLVVANFPTNFTSDAARRLLSIMSSGPACGVCTLVGMDTAYPLPRDFNAADLEQVALTLNIEGNKFKLQDKVFAPFPLTVDNPPDPQTIAKVVNRVGQASLTAARVEVPFDYILPEKFWAASAARAFEVPVGRAGATRKQIFMLGRGTSQHALVAGKTGSGKSTLLHALIVNLAATYSPEEAELYMIDFKKGVEFQAYATHRLPHARVIAIESEREFGLSVLQRLDGILRERGENFRMAGTNDLGGYRAARPNEVCPRILFVVDEFQEFFVEDDKVAQEAALLLDRLVRQGRAFGVHVMLGSQTLGGAFSLARSTIDQMAVRVALQCSEADAQLILSKDNTAARLLSRPGDAIYNDANGRIEGNNPFQVVWLSDNRKEQILNELRERGIASGKNYPPPLVFEGTESADISKNRNLARLIAMSPEQIPAGPPLLFLGDPVAIKEPTVAALRPQSAANALLLGQHEEAALSLMAVGLAGLTAKLRPQANGNGNGRVFTIIDGTPDDGEYADYLRNASNALGLTGAVIDRPAIPTAIAELAAELNRRQNGETPDRTPRFLFVHGLHRLRELRKAEEEFGYGRRGEEKKVSPGEHFANILREGPPLGIHCIVWCDSLTNLQRSLDRAALKDFVYRVLFQMSPSDSSNLLDSPAASRLGKNRALFAEEGSERPEKFRPYSLPSEEWLKKAGEQMAGVPA